MFKPTNFSDRAEKAVAVHVKAQEELKSLRNDILIEQKATQVHLEKLGALRTKIEDQVDALDVVLGKTKK